MLALMLPPWTGGWHAHDHQPCRMFCITHGTTLGENPRPFGSRLRGARGHCVPSGGCEGPRAPGATPRPSAWPRRSPKVRHNNHRREPSSRYSPGVSPRHTAAGTTPGQQPFTLRNTAMCARPGRPPAPVTRPAPGVLREPARTLHGDGAGRSPHPKPGPRPMAGRVAARSRRGPRECHGHLVPAALRAEPGAG